MCISQKPKKFFFMFSEMSFKRRNQKWNLENRERCLVFGLLPSSAVTWSDHRQMDINTKSFGKCFCFFLIAIVHTTFNWTNLFCHRYSVSRFSCKKYPINSTKALLCKWETLLKLATCENQKLYPGRNVLYDVSLILKLKDQLKCMKSDFSFSELKLLLPLCVLCPRYGRLWCDHIWGKCFPKNILGFFLLQIMLDFCLMYFIL